MFRWFKNISKLLLPLILLVGYQNCADMKSTSSTSTQSSQTTNDDDTSPPVPPTPPPTPPTPPTPPSSNKVNVFVASGHMARTVISCDDGKTWIHDQSANDATRCWVSGDPNYVECDHSPYAARGLDYNDGWFFATFGWGYTGSVRRSQDATTWQNIRTDSTAGGLAYANNILFVNWQNGFRSSDQGDTWTPLTTTLMEQFDHEMVSRAGNYFIAIGRPTTSQRFAISQDQGATWILPSTMQTSDWIKKVAASSTRLVAIGYNGNNVGYSATSTDGGNTWTIRQQTSSNLQWEQLIFDGEKFVSWGAGQRWVSYDGLNWLGQPFTAQNIGSLPFFGPVSYDLSTGTYVTILNVWDNYYNKQRALRSTDGGLTWIPLSSSDFHGGHPIFYIASGQVDASICAK